MFYVVTINGEVATVAQLDEEDGERLYKYAAEINGLDRIHVSEQAVVQTQLEFVKEDIQSELDAWH